MSELSREIRKHLTKIPKHLQKRDNGLRLLAAAEEIEALEAELAGLRKARPHRHAHSDGSRIPHLEDDDEGKR